MTSIKLDRLDAALSALQDLSLTGEIVNQELIRSQIEDTLQMPTDDPLVAEVILHPYVLRMYAQSLAERTTPDKVDADRNALIKNLVWKRTDDDRVVRARKFQSEGGVYYGMPLHTGAGAYAIINDEPVLLTILPREWRDELFIKTELGWLSRPEVRMLAALSFSTPSDHGPVFYFQMSEQFYDLPPDLVLEHRNELDIKALNRFQIVDRILTRIHMLDLWGFESVSQVFSPYRFRTKEIMPGRTEKLYRSFDIEDQLALRTAFLLIKAATLWGHGERTFGEDASANLFFGLEGCLRLVYRRMSQGDSFELKPTIAHIAGLFPQRPGYPWMLEDAYAKRIQIVHPEATGRIGWLPNIYADDFYENYGMAIILFYYAMTGDTLPVTD